MILKQPYHELLVVGKQFMAGIDQKKSKPERSPFLKIIIDHFIKFRFFRPGDFCITVPGKIHQEPGVVDVEMVDKSGFSRGL